jgi:hypothetical protein
MNDIRDLKKGRYETMDIPLYEIFVSYRLKWLLSIDR